MKNLPCKLAEGFVSLHKMKGRDIGLSEWLALHFFDVGQHLFEMWPVGSEWKLAHHSVLLLILKRSLVDGIVDVGSHLTTKQRNETHLCFCPRTVILMLAKNKMQKLSRVKTIKTCDDDYIHLGWFRWSWLDGNRRQRLYPPWFVSIILAGWK